MKDRPRVEIVCRITLIMYMFMFYLYVHLYDLPLHARSFQFGTSAVKDPVNISQPLPMTVS